MHRHVAEPGEEHGVPEGELHLARQRIAACPDHRLRGIPQPTTRIHAELTQPDETKGEKHEHHPRRGDIGHARHEGIPVRGYQGHRAPEQQNGDDPSQAVGIDVVQLRHREVEPHAKRSRRDGDHRAGQEAEHHAVGQVVGDSEPAAADSFELVIQRQARARRDRRRHEHPAEDRQQVADEQPDDEIERADAGGHEQRTDHQLGARGVLAGVLADKAPEPQPRPFRHGFAFVLVDDVLRRAGARSAVTTGPTIDQIRAEGHCARAAVDVLNARTTGAPRLMACNS